MLQAGEVFGGTYLLERQLGKGGMGEVWLARHVLLDEYRAIKIVLGEIAGDSGYRERFVRGEARNALRLEHHPNIVRVYELGQHQGMPYMVMEYIEGTNLRQLLNERKTLPPAEAGLLLEQIARGLEVAHRLGIIHRDIKPANVLIDRNGVAKLSDFGLTKDLDKGKDDSLTGTGQYMGTPTYMSPEQAFGYAGRRSDIYSLGVLVYEMLAGRPPFSGVMTSVIVQHATGQPPLIRSFNPAVPERVELVVMRALAKRPEDRYDSALEFAGAYKQALEVVDAQRSGETTPLPRPDSLPVQVSPTYPQPVTRPPQAGNTPQPAPPPTPTPTPFPVTVNTPTIINNPPTPGVKAARRGLAPLVLVLLGIALFVTIAVVLFFLFASTPGGGQNPAAAKITPTFTLPTAGNPLVFGTPEDAIYGMDVSPDGKYIAASFSSGTIKLWEVESGKELPALNGHRTTVYSVNFSSDGKQLLSCSADGTLRLWSIPEGSLIRSFESHQDAVYNCHFLPGDKSFLSFGADKMLMRWDVASNTPTSRTPVADARNNAYIAFSPDKKIFASGEADGSVVLYDSEKNTEISRIPPGSDLPIAMAFNPAGDQLAVGQADSIIRLWDLKSNSQVIRLERGGSALAYSPDGAFLISAELYAEGRIDVWDVRQGAQQSGAFLHERYISRVGLLPGGKIVTASYDNTVRITSLKPLQVEKVFGTPSPAITTLAFSPDGTLAAYNLNRKIVIGDVASASTKFTLDDLGNSVNRLAFSPDGKRLASIGYGYPYDSHLTIWSMENGKMVSDQKTNYEVAAVTYSPDGKKLVIGSYGQIIVLDAATNQQVADLKPPQTVEQYVSNLVYLNEQVLAIGWTDGQIMTWDSGGGNDLKPFASCSPRVESLTLSPDRKTLVCGTNEGMIHFFDAATGKESRSFDTKQYSINSLAFDKSGSRLAAAVTTREIWIWKLADNASQPAQKLTGHNDSVSGFGFILDENYGLSVSRDGTVRVWKL